MTVGPWSRRVSLIHVADAVSGLIDAGESPHAPGRTYCVAHPTPISWDDVVTAIALALDRRPLRVELPVGAARMVAVLAEAGAYVRRRAAILNRDRVREIAQACWVCDVTAAIAELGFAPHYPLMRGIGHTADWLRREQWI
jgi:nucleoside-diphosphate-sugar epimerase